jgi:xylulokinase
MSDLAAAARIDLASPLFLPHLEGERAPLWDAASRGGFAGLASAHGPAEVAAAVMEGVAFSARLALEAVEASGGRRAARLRLGGGGASSAVWARIRADALGRRLEPVVTAEPGALGALVMAGAGTGVLPGLGAAAATLVRTGPAIDPDPAAAERADTRFAAWRELHGALRPVTDRLRA